MSHYRHVFFDLDHTLWDFEKNSAETLLDLYHLFHLKQQGMDNPHDFISRYHHHNAIFWSLFHRNLISRETLRLVRFEKTLEEFNIRDPDLPAKLSEKYIELLPYKTNLFDDTLEILDYLFPQYTLHLITNGFHEVQQKKLDHSGLRKYFREIITSEVAGAQKPAREIFRFALSRSGATLRNSIFIGDSLEADVEGARNAGMDYVFYNPAGTPHGQQMMHEIRALRELRNIL